MNEAKLKKLPIEKTNEKLEFSDEQIPVYKLQSSYKPAEINIDELEALIAKINNE